MEMKDLIQRFGGDLFQEPFQGALTLGNALVEGKQFCGLTENFPGLILGVPLADFAVHKGLE